MWIPCFIPLYSPLNLYLIILWILDFKYILLLLLLLLYQWLLDPGNQEGSDKTDDTDIQVIQTSWSNLNISGPS